MAPKSRTKASTKRAGTSPSSARPPKVPKTSPSSTRGDTSATSPSGDEFGDERAAAIAMIRDSEDIDLVFGKGEKFYATFCAPHELSGTTRMVRVHPVSSKELPDQPAEAGDRDAKSDVTSKHPVLTITEKVGRSRSEDDMNCDMFRATVHVNGTKPKRQAPKRGLVLKLLDLDFMPPRLHLHRKRDMAEECYTFGLASHLQGTCLPRFAGLFQHGTLYCLVYEDAGRFCFDEVRSAEYRPELLKVFQDLYDAGVVPRDHDDYWMRLGLDNRLKVSTLWNATTLENLHSSDMERSRRIRGRTPTPEEAFEDLKSSRMDWIRQYGL